MSGLDLMLFGPPRALHAGAPLHFERHKTVALLTYLAVSGRPHGRDALAAFLWPEADQVQARGDLRRALSELRQILGPNILHVAGDQVGLQTGEMRVDVTDFRAGLARVEAHGHGHDPLCASCLAALSEAVTLYDADFLAGFSLRDAPEFDTWQTFTTETLRLELSAALERLATGLAARRQHAEALAYARRWLAFDPLNEPGHRLVMRLFAAAGDRAAAKRQYEQCVRTLAEELGIEPAPETTDLYDALMPGSPAADPTWAGASVPPPPPAAPHNLPPDVTPFIGRQDQLTRVAERLADPACRLLTVLGPGGIGKTRLAIAAARDEVDRFPHGVWFVDLAPLASAEQLAGTILGTLGVVEQGSAGTDERLLDYLRDRRLLLVLDNYEHLLTGPEPERRDGYGLVKQLVGAAPEVKLLVTSRSRLNIAAEWLVPLEGLVVPRQAPPEQVRHSHSPAAVRSELEQYSATHLFLGCLERLQPGRGLTAADGHTIAHICRLLDGVPLAIELAAAWTRALSLEEIVRRLEHGLELLTTSLRGVPARQRSMAATFDYSWRLLAPRERSILRQLAVFQGGFSAEAAEAVTGASLGDLANLVDASWLRLGEAGRYAVHELIRQYCEDKLAQEHEAETGEPPNAVRARHARYFQPLVTRGWIEAFRRPGFIKETALNLGNLWVAWEWSLAAQDLAGIWHLSFSFGLLTDRQGSHVDMLRVFETGLQQVNAIRAAAGGDREWDLLAALLLVMRSEMRERMGRLAESGADLEEAERLLGERRAGDARWAEMHYFRRRMLGWLLQDLGDYAGSARIFRELTAEGQAGLVSLPPYTPEGARLWGLESNWAMGYAIVALGEYDEALRLAVRGVRESRAVGCELLAAYSMRVQVFAQLYLGAYREAEQVARHMLRAANRFDDGLLLSQAISLLGRTQLMLGRPERARACFRRCLELARNAGMQDCSGGTFALLGHAEFALGDLAAAERCFRQAQDQGWVAPGLYGLARLALARGDAVQAQELCRSALARPSLWAELYAFLLIRLAEALAQTGEPEQAAELCGFLLAWRGTLYAVRPAAEKLAGELAERLPAEVHAAAISRGAARELSAVIAEIVAEVD